MLKVYYGEQGMGKSRKMCEGANERLLNTNGTVVFIDKDEDHMYDLKRDVRCINASEYGISGRGMLMGFAAGIAARDFDLDALFINSFKKLVVEPSDALADVIDFFARLSEKTGADIFLSINGGGQPCPDFIAEYCDPA